MAIILFEVMLDEPHQFLISLDAPALRPATGEDRWSGETGVFCDAARDELASHLSMQLKFKCAIEFNRCPIEMSPT
jgi:hypothetical protein